MAAFDRHNFHEMDEAFLEINLILFIFFHCGLITLEDVDKLRRENQRWDFYYCLVTLSLHKGVTLALQGV
jgi:hypothetical protein